MEVRVLTFLFLTLTTLLIRTAQSQQIPDAEFYIEEEIKLTSVVGNISDLPNLFPGTSADVRRSLTYGILDQASQPASLFNITRDSGVFVVARRIDREELCPGQEECVLKLNVLVSSLDPSRFDSKVVTVFFVVSDINDNPPNFGRSEVVLEISEGNSVSSVLKITGANDKDYEKQFKTQNYTLNGFGDVFELTASRTLDGSSEIDLRLLTSLDREVRDRYEFDITAFDGGSPPLQADLRVTVVVTDKNDNPPVFQNASYDVVLEGPVERDAFICQVSATDKDIDDNGKITYDFSSLQKRILADSFEIDSVTGEIFAAGTLSSGDFSFIVEAQDSGYPSLKSQTEVSVKVINTGNSPPLVTITTLGTNMENNTISLPEPGGRGLFVAFVDVSDDADGVVCDVNNAVFSMEPIPSKGYKISLQGDVDRERQDLYDLSVNCVDAGLPPLRSTASFFVRISDVNDNAPKFNQPRYSRTLTEGQKDGEFVLQVTASDKDIHNNGDVRYSLDPNFRHVFNIDAITGYITAIGELDRENQTAMTFDVYATDRGSPPLRDSAKVSVFLEDINDNVPVFTEKVFRFKAREEINGHRVINTLTARDEDSGMNGQVEYFFTGSTDGADGVFVVLTNGTIVSNARLDREERENYTFSVMARDKGNPPLMSSASVIIIVTDINDNAPEILFPDTKVHRIPITNVPEKGGLTLISAHDNDAGENGSLKFTIVAGNEDRAFEINQANGEFRIARPTRIRNHRHYKVDIVVSDRGSPPKANTTTLIIEVSYKNITSLRKEKEEDYIVIVAVVAAVTVVFSTLIIVAICVVFQKDRLSRRRPGNQKTSFQNLGDDLAFSDDDKVGHPGNSGSNPRPADRTSYSMDDLARHGEPRAKSPAQHGQYFQTKFSFPDKGQQQQQIPKGKAVSFCLESGDRGTSNHPSSHTMTSKTTASAPPLSTFCTPTTGPRETRKDPFLLPPTPGSRLVSGVTYAPVSTHGQVDDVTSDTSADTSTSDSGHGNSVDDVTLEHLGQGELPSRSTTAHSHGRYGGQEPELPPRKPFQPEVNLPPYHMVCSTPRDTHQSCQGHQIINPNAYSGGQSRSSDRVDPKVTRSNPQSHSKAARSGKPSTPRHHHHGNQKQTMAPSLSTFSSSNPPSPSRQVSWGASVDDDNASTTTSGSYVINQDDVRMDTYIGTDVVV